MEDIACSLGVAEGTLYVYVESKEALFDLVLRCADTVYQFRKSRRWIVSRHAQTLT